MLLELKDIHISFNIAGREKHILQGVGLSVKENQIVSITGRSGCGKTTLFNIISGLVKPKSGKVYIDGSPLSYAFDIMPARIRSSKLGFIFQTFRLINSETVLNNILLPARINNSCTKATIERADYLLEKVGLYNHRARKASLLSGGQQQRVAIARAFINDPKLILADEPDANLDPETSDSIFQLLIEMKNDGKSIVIITHKKSMHKNSLRVYNLDNGVLVKKR